MGYLEKERIRLHWQKKGYGNVEPYRVKIDDGDERENFFALEIPN